MFIIFLLASLAELIALFATVAYEENTGGFISLVIYGAVVHFFCHINLFSFIQDHWKDLAIGASLYVVAGILWSIIRWTLFVRDTRDAYLAAKAAVDQTLPQDKIQARYAEIQQEFKYSHKFPPQPLYFQEKIISWTAYWPVSIVSFVFSDLVVRFFNRIYKTFSGIYTKISDSAFSGLDS